MCGKGIECNVEYDVCRDFFFEQEFCYGYGIEQVMYVDWYIQMCVVESGGGIKDLLFWEIFFLCIVGCVGGFCGLEVFEDFFEW